MKLSGILPRIDAIMPVRTSPDPAVAIPLLPFVLMITSPFGEAMMVRASLSTVMTP
jgi:hypothetical protein